MKPGYEQIRNDREINLLIEQGNRNLKVLGYTEHSRKHAVKVAETAGRILKELGYRRRQVEMAKIAGYMHDIGNTVNRYDHAHSSAVTGTVHEIIFPIQFHPSGSHRSTGCKIIPFAAQFFPASRHPSIRFKVIP